MPQIQMWETEYGDLVCWGTHDVFTAEQVFIEKSIEWWGDSECDTRSWHDAKKFYGDPDLPDEEGFWPDTKWGVHPKEPTWVPYLVLIA